MEAKRRDILVEDKRGNKIKQNIDAYINAHKKASDIDPNFKERISVENDGKKVNEYKKVDYGTNKKE